MSNLKDIKRRIGSVKSTQKITNAMKLVSAAKFARANHAIQSARPYAEAFDQMVERLLHGADEDIGSSLLEVRPVKRVLIAIFSSDRGLCGGLNNNLFKAVSHMRRQFAPEVQVDLAPWSRRAVLFAKKTGLKTVEAREKVVEQPDYIVAAGLGNFLISSFEAGDYDEVYLAFPKFQSALNQIPTIAKLLPLSLQNPASHVGAPDIIVEPAMDTMIDGLISRKVIGKVFLAMLETAASEHGARMTAMDSATSNAKEVIKKLTLVYNRARQAAITTELTEIISGAEALN